jgi:hypothetical protein
VLQSGSPENTTTPKDKAHFTRYPVVSLGAEHLVTGHLMRRNILTYKAPPNNEGYDLICMHPDPRLARKQIRVQVKSRLATDCDRGFPVKARTFDAFDYVIVVFLNVGYFFGRRQPGYARAGAGAPEFYTLPAAFIREHHNTASSWEKVRTRGLDLSRYRDEQGFEQIARRLKIPYPQKATPKPPPSRRRR